MAFFGVTVETIKTIEAIEGADRIQKASLEGLPFNFVIGKDTFKVGDTVLYFPIDSLIPQKIAEKLGVAGKLAGKDKDRVKTIKLKGVFSQGIVGPFSLIEPFLIENWGEDWVSKGIDLKPSEITEWLGVTKYEPPAVLEKGANLKPLPTGLSVYDIEGIDRNQDVFALLKNQPVYVSEKVEGSNFSVTFDNQRFFVNQRRFTIEPLDGHDHTWWKVAKEQGLMDFAARLSVEYSSAPVTVYGEMIGPGIQGNIYKLSKHEVRVFDIKIGPLFMPASEFLRITELQGILTAPNLGVFDNIDVFLAGKTIIEASNGKSILNPNTLREGIVIKPMIEQIVDKFGRLILKQRDPIYLAGTDN
jgi:RNA ligase (TIGR02306 family)